MDTLAVGGMVFGIIFAVLGVIVLITAVNTLAGAALFLGGCLLYGLSAIAGAIALK